MKWGGENGMQCGNGSWIKTLGGPVECRSGMDMWMIMYEIEIGLRELGTEWR